MIKKIINKPNVSYNDIIKIANKALSNDEFVTYVTKNVINFKSPHNMMHSKAGAKYSYARLIKRGKLIIDKNDSEILLTFKIELFFPVLFGIVIIAVNSLLFQKIFNLTLIPLIIIIALFVVVLMTYRIKKNIEQIMNQIRSGTLG